MLALSGLCEGLARGWPCLHTACPEQSRRAHLPVPKIPAAKPCISLTSNLIQIKRLQVLHFGHLRKTRGRGVLSLPFSTLATRCSFTQSRAHWPLSPLFPLHTKSAHVTPLFPLLTQKQGSTPRSKNVGAPTFLIFPHIFRSSAGRRLTPESAGRTPKRLLLWWTRTILRARIRMMAQVLLHGFVAQRELKSALRIHVNGGLQIQFVEAPYVLNELRADLVCRCVNRREMDLPVHQPVVRHVEDRAVLEKKFHQFARPLPIEERRIVVPLGGPLAA